MVSFVSFILKFKNDDSAIGDLARDIEMDKRINRNLGYKKLIAYLSDINACSGALNAVDDAYELYKAID